MKYKIYSLIEFQRSTNNDNLDRYIEQIKNNKSIGK